MKEKTYQFGKSKLTLRFGDITTTDTQVIVSSDDYYLSMGGGVSASISKAGGNEIALDAAKNVPAELGDVVVTTAGRLKSKFVFHGITIGNGTDRTEPKDIVKSTTIKCLDLLTTLNVNSISFPALGAGMAGFSYEDVAIEMSKVISEYLAKSKLELDVIIYLFDRYGKMQPTDYIVFFEAFANKAPQIAVKEINEPQIEKELPKPNLKATVSETEQEIKAKRLHHLRNLLGALEDQRNRIEVKLIDQLENSDSKEYQNSRVN
jgi:O-acetyl-ADP-ribose deacetylase (regulator of RNase III)